jgi:hypothetical protein
MTALGIWGVIRSRVLVGTSIRNWTLDSGYLGDKFTITGIGKGHLVIETPGAKGLQHVSRVDFETVYKIWSDYLCGVFRRDQIRDMTRFSKYVISILHWAENEEGERGR